MKTFINVFLCGIFSAVAMGAAGDKLFQKTTVFQIGKAPNKVVCTVSEKEVKTTNEVSLGEDSVVYVDEAPKGITPRFTREGFEHNLFANKLTQMIKSLPSDNELFEDPGIGADETKDVKWSAFYPDKNGFLMERILAQSGKVNRTLKSEAAQSFVVLLNLLCK